MKRFSARRVSIGALAACLLALPLGSCSRSDSGPKNPDPDKIKQEAERLRQENQKMFNK